MSWTNIESDLKNDVHKVIGEVKDVVAKVEAAAHHLLNKVEGQAEGDAKDVTGDVHVLLGELKDHGVRLTQLAEQAVEHPDKAPSDVFEAVKDVEVWGKSTKDEVVADVKTEVEQAEEQLAEDIHPHSPNSV